MTTTEHTTIPSPRAPIDAPAPAVRRPRVWLVAGLGTATGEPADRPVVRDDLMRHWEPAPDGRYATTDGRHHATWSELHARYDLIEVTR